MPYCETHYHAKRGSLCAGCSKPITGRCITAMFRKFHPEHFVCAFCLKQLNKGEKMTRVATRQKSLMNFFFVLICPQARLRSRTISPIATAASTSSLAKENSLCVFVETFNHFNRPRDPVSLIASSNVFIF